MTSFSSFAGYRKVFLAAAFIALLSSSAPSLSAQEEELHAAPSETIHLKVGDIFEILPIHNIPDATYTWILTQDRTFLEANRAPSFRKRLIQPGTYTLYAEIASADGTQRISRTISLDYDARQPGESMDQTSGSGTDVLVKTEPVADDKGRIVLPTGTQLLELLPVNPDVVPLALDIDLAKDADNDGRPDNDIQAQDTFFHSDATPLFLWITDDPLMTHSISVMAAGTDGARTQKLDILNQEIGAAQGAVQSPVRIQSEQTGERTYMFTAEFENPDTAAGQLLYQWQFGDGEESLVTKPEHTFADEKTYEVSLLIRNLRDGSEIASTSVALAVTGGTPTSSSEASSQATSEQTNPSQSSGIGIGSVLMLVGLFLLSLIMGVGLIFLIGKLRGSSRTSLADKLESMEKVVVKSPVDQTPNLTIAPPSVVTEKKLQEPPASIAEREKELAVEPPAPLPTPKQESTPSWLTTPTPKPSPTPTPAPVPAPKPVTPPPAPAPVQTPKPAASEPSTQTPAWLQTPAAPAMPKPPAAVPAPAVQKPAESLAPAKPMQPQAPVPAPVTPKPAPQTPSTPAWLQTPAAPAAPTPVTPAAPVQTPAPKPVPAPVVQPQVQKPVEPPAPVAPAAPVPTPKPAAPVIPSAPQIPKPVAPVPPAPAPVVETPKPQPPVMPPKPVTPPPAPAPVVPQPPKPVAQQPIATPTPIPAPIAPVQPVTPPAPKPAATPAPAPSSPTPEAKPAPTQMDIPPASDEQIAIIRAESLNPKDQQNG